MMVHKTAGWKSSCNCVQDTLGPIPCTVMDPFHGTGTTAMVATGLGRAYIGCEISEVYLKDSDVRDAQGGLL